MWTFKTPGAFDHGALGHHHFVGSVAIVGRIDRDQHIFVCSSARMIPGMAIISASAQPQLRQHVYVAQWAVQSSRHGWRFQAAARSAATPKATCGMAAMVGRATVVAVNLVGTFTALRNRYLLRAL